jgi:MOSC domain-containing protein YiiM
VFSLTARILVLHGLLRNSNRNSSDIHRNTMRMKLVSLNLGVPREVTWHGTTVSTGIFKQPVDGTIALRKLNLDGDRQADLSVHGGKDKAVYCYPLEHYEYWKKQLPGHELPLGVFGENFTLDFGGDDVGGASENPTSPENVIHIGDRFSIGSAEVVVTQPRLPCYKLGIRFQMDDMVKRFLASGRSGFYLAVTREGEVGAGDEMKPLSQDPNAVPVSAITQLYIAKQYSDDNLQMLQRALGVAALPESWKEYFRERLQMVHGLQG